MGLIKVIILAVIQGLTEFLPISSSGHLVIVARLLTSGDQELDVVDLNIALHVGTLFSILVFYWQRVRKLIGEDRNVVGLLIVGTLPAVVVGPILKIGFHELLNHPLLAGSLLLVTGVTLLWSASRQHGDVEYQQMSYQGALFIGTVQAAAIFPGLSRSGLTITAGLTSGLSRQSAATFSFLLAIPAIAGAGVWELVDMARGDPSVTPLPHLAIGAVVAFLVGFLSLAWLIRWLQRGRLHWFAWWCFLVGALVIAWQMGLIDLGT